MFRAGLPVSHSGQNVIQLCICAGMEGKNKQMSGRSHVPEHGEHVPSVELTRAEHDDPIMPRGIALHDLIHDEGGHGACNENGEQLEGDDGRVGRAPACVRSSVFTPCTYFYQDQRSKRRVRGFSNAHIWAKAPEDVFTVRPNVDRARKEPSKMKWISASNVCLLCGHTRWLLAAPAENK